MVMEHAEALERIEIAAAEPDGLERLMAGDTPEAAAVAGHLAGCSSCTDELARIRRTSAIAREVIHAEPDPALRERTLAFVRAVGRDRSPAAAVHVPEHAPAAEVAAAVAVAPTPVATVPAPTAVTVGRPIPIETARGRSRRWAWLAVAAAIVIAVAGVSFYAGGAQLRSDQTAHEQEVKLLADTAATAVRIGAQPDAQTVALTATPASPDATGKLAFSATNGELVAVAWGLEPEAAGEAYGCWVEVNGQREKLGRMYWAGDMWTWAGPVSGLGDLPAGALFGVSVSSASGTSEPVLTGHL
jgi:hypothetical protein